MSPEPRLRRRTDLTRRMLLAVGLTLAALVLQWAFEPIAHGQVPFLFFMPAIILAGAWSGLVPAVGVAIVGALTGALAIRQGDALLIQTHPQAWAVIAYFVISGTLLYLGRRLYVTSRRASSAEMRLRTAEDDAAVGLFEIDVVNGTLFASSGFWQLIGRPPLDGPVPLAAWLRVLHPSDVEDARALLLKPPADLRAEIEHRVLLPSGETHWVMTRIRGEGVGDRTVRVRGVMVDITHRKEAAEALARTQVELRQQVADLNELHELSTRLEATDGLPAQLEHVVRTLARMHGCERGLVSLADETRTRQKLAASIGFSPAAVAMLADVPVRDDDPCGRALADGQRVIIEDVANDDRCAPYRDFAAAEGFRALHATPLLDHAGELLGALIVHLPEPRAITARELRLADICAAKAAVFIEHARAEARAHENDRRFRSVLDGSAAGFAVLRPERDETGIIRDFRWMYVNPAAAASWQRRPEQFIGKRVMETLPGAWENGELFDAYVSVARDRQLREFEHQTVQTPRSEWFHVIASPLDGDVAVWFSNVTARRRNEQALMEADQRKDEFLATLAHELRNPLAPIRQATQIAMLARASETQKRWSYQVIERQVQHMSLLLDDLLDISRITRGQLRLRRQSCELSEVFNAAVEAARPLIDKKGHEFVLDLPTSEVWVDADPLRLSQILSNLLTNAAKYTNSNGRIRASARSVGRELVLEVSDNGIGLESTELVAVFNMFSQVTAAQERSEGGLGIGLALTRGLVQLHGGSIEARSDGPGKGATFTARLPIVSTKVHTGEGEVQRAAVVHASGSLRLRLVIADDNRDAAESLAMLMRLEGHEVHLAHDGASALTTVGNVRPDAALLDIGMPGLSGYEVARAVRADSRLQGMYLVAITGWGQAADKARALSEGFDVHMTKPVDVHRLLDLLQNREPPPALLTDQLRSVEQQQADQ